MHFVTIRTGGKRIITTHYGPMSRSEADALAGQTNMPAPRGAEQSLATVHTLVPLPVNRAECPSRAPLRPGQLVDLEAWQPICPCGRQWVDCPRQVRVLISEHASEANDQEKCHVCAVQGCSSLCPLWGS